MHNAFTPFTMIMLILGVDSKGYIITFMCNEPILSVVHLGGRILVFKGPFFKKNVG